MKVDRSVRYKGRQQMLYPAMSGGDYSLRQEPQTVNQQHDI